MKQIPLTQGKFALVDDEMFDELNQYEWHLDKHERNEYAKRWISIGIKNKRTVQKGVKMHQQIMEKRGYFGPIDHIDGNGLNNQGHNLRPTNKSLNGANSIKKQTNSASLFKGLVLRKNGYWEANAHKDRKKYYAGRSKDEIEAAKLYDKKMIELYGDLVNDGLNFPIKKETQTI